MCQSQWRIDAPKTPTIPYYKSLEVFNRGLNVIIEVDRFNEEYGIGKKNIEDAVQSGVTNAGWRYNNSSDLFIKISIDTATSKNTKAKKFIIIGNSFLNEPSTRKSIEISKGNTTLIQATLTQVILNIATRARKVILKRDMTKPDPDYLAPKYNNWL